MSVDDIISDYAKNTALSQYLSSLRIVLSEST